VRDIGPIKSIENFNLSEHVCGSTPIDVGWRQTNKPRLNLIGGSNTESISEPGVAGHMVHVENFNIRAFILCRTEGAKTTRQLVKVHV
jgi:hypothetical protein